MKILMASHYFGSHRSGVEIVADHLFRRFSAADLEVIWAAGDATPPPDAVRKSRASSLPILNFVEKSIGLPFPIPTIAALRKLNREVNKVDLLILHDCLYLTNIAAFLIARLRRIPTVIIQHTRISPYKSRLLNLIMWLATAFVTKPMLSRADQVVFVSEATGKYFERVRFRRSPQIIFNGLDVDMYRPRTTGETKVGLRRKYNLPRDRPVILFVGRFVEKKGIEVMRLMTKLRPGYTWVFAGWGPADPVAWQMPNVRVFGALEVESVAALYRTCDLLALPSVGEGFPLVIQEALASGLPVVSSTDNLAADSRIEEFAYGVKAVGNDENTAQRFVVAIDSVLAEETDTKSSMRRDFAVSSYSWSRTTERYLGIARILSDRASARLTPLEAHRGVEE
jgi:glycosyltransferase involved in cell wall biosynthesis